MSAGRGSVLGPPALHGSAASPSLNGSAQDPTRASTVSKSIVQMWRGSAAKDDKLNGSVSSADGKVASAQAAMLEKKLEALVKRTGVLEGRLERQDRAAEELQHHVQKVDSENMSLRRELDLAHKHIEAGTIAIEHEKGRKEELARQLRYLGEQMTQWHNERMTPEQASYWAVAGWVYIPLLYVVRGVWFLVWPIINTFQHMTLFGYSPDDEDDDEASSFLSRPTTNGSSTRSNGSGNAKHGSDGSKLFHAHQPGSLLERLSDGSLAGTEKLAAAAAKRREETGSRPRLRRTPVSGNTPVATPRTDT